MTDVWDVTDNPTCTCGHVEDEHSLRNGTCEIDGCLCACWDEEVAADD